MLLTIIIFIITLLILVVSHEFGHFIVARKAGIKVLEFGFGLPPRIFGKKWGDTLVSLNWLPIGGFVKLSGEDEVDKKVLLEKDSFAAKSVGARIAVVVAGVAMNLALAVIIFWGVLAAQNFKTDLPLLIPFQFSGVSQVNETAIYVGGVADGSPAATSGIKSGDRIVSINGNQLQNVDQLVGFIKEHAGEQLQVEVLDLEKNTRRVVITPRVNPPAGQGALGVELGTMTIAHLGYDTTVQKLASGFTHSYNLTVYSGAILGQLISTSIQTKNLDPVSQSVSGPVGITNITSTILNSKEPVLPYLSFIGMLSLNLAVINILPFPALDGGRLLFLLIEAVFRRRIKAEIEKLIHTVGMMLLIALIILVTFSDIKKFF